MLRLLVILFAVHCASAQITFNCLFQNAAYDAPIGTAYTCEAEVIRVGEGRNVVGVTGTHQPGWTNPNVRALRILGQAAIDFMPGDINLFFANLEAIVFSSTPIRSISKEDLRPFPELGFFAISSGELTTVRGDVFMHTPKVEYMRFDSNRITNIGPGIFQHTPNMTSAFLHGNLCIDHSVSHNAAEVALIGQELAFRCPPTVEMTEDIILNGGNFQQAVGVVVESEITEIDGRIKHLTEEIGEFSANQTIISKQIQQFQEDNEKLFNNLASAEEKIKQLEEANDILSNNQTSAAARIQLLEDTNSILLEEILQLKEENEILSNSHAAAVKRMEELEKSVLLLCALYPVC